jgi:tripartite-type tricarboxylate transporter receptor subunit TctC
MAVREKVGPSSESRVASVKSSSSGSSSARCFNASKALPDVPTVGEFVTGYEAIGWYGISAPKGTSTEIVNKLNKEINAGLADPKMKARLADLGGEGMPMTPVEFGKLIAEETEKWAKVIRAASIRPE